MDKSPVRGVQGNCSRVGNTVCYTQEFHFHFPDADFFAVRHGSELCFTGEALFIQALPCHGHGEFRSIALGEMERRQKVLNSTYMIQVAVGEENRFDAVLFPLEGRDVRHEVIYSQHIFVREFQTEINHVDVSVDFNARAVAADLFKAAEGVNSQSSLAWSLHSYLLWLYTRLGGDTLLLPVKFAERAVPPPPMVLACLVWVLRTFRWCRPFALPRLQAPFGALQPLSYCLHL